MKTKFVVANRETGDLAIWLGCEAFQLGEEVHYWPFHIETNFGFEYLQQEEFQKRYAIIGEL